MLTLLLLTSNDLVNKPMQLG